MKSGGGFLFRDWVGLGVAFDREEGEGEGGLGRGTGVVGGSGRGSGTVMRGGGASGGVLTETKPGMVSSWGFEFRIEMRVQVW